LVVAAATAAPATNAKANINNAVVAAASKLLGFTYPYLVNARAELLIILNRVNLTGTVPDVTSHQAPAA
jgi:hypothetical protein